MARIARTADGWITPDRLRGYPIVFIAMSVAMLGMTLLHPPITADFLAHWTGGRIVLDGNNGAMYDPDAQAAVQSGLTPNGALSWFVAPPFVAYAYTPFAVFGYQAAAVLWTLFSVACMVAAGWLVRPFAPRLFRDHGRIVYVALAATEPVLETLGSGQDSGVTVLLWVAGIRLLLAGRDVAGGSVLALGLMKPQLFFAVPFVLIAQRKWRALSAWAATTAGLGVVSVQAVGVRGVIEWVKLPFSDTFHEAAQVGQAWKMQSLPALAESFGMAHVGLLVALIGFGMLLRQLWVRRTIEPLTAWMLTITATVAISPHVVVYDLLVLLVPVLWLLEHHNTRTVRLSCLALFALTWTIYGRHVLGAPFDAAWSAAPVVALWVEIAHRKPHAEASASRRSRSSNPSAPSPLAH